MNKWLYFDHSRSFTIYVIVTRKHLHTWRTPSEEIPKGDKSEGCQKKSSKHSCITGRVFLTPTNLHSCWWWPGIPPEAQPTNNKQHGSWHRKTPARLSDTAGLFPGPGRAAVVEVGAGRLVGSGAHRPFSVTWVVIWFYLFWSKLI